MFSLYGLILVLAVALIAFALVAISLNKASEQQIINNNQPVINNNNNQPVINNNTTNVVQKGRESIIPKNSDEVPHSINNPDEINNNTIGPNGNNGNNKKFNAFKFYFSFKLHAASQPKGNCITNGILVFIRLAFCCK